jgi:hypothetical protein
MRQTTMTLPDIGVTTRLSLSKSDSQDSTGTRLLIPSLNTRWNPWSNSRAGCFKHSGRDPGNRWMWSLLDPRPGLLGTLTPDHHSVVDIATTLSPLQPCPVGPQKFSYIISTSVRIFNFPYIIKNAPPPHFPILSKVKKSLTIFEGVHTERQNWWRKLVNLGTFFP